MKAISLAVVALIVGVGCKSLSPIPIGKHTLADLKVLELKIKPAMTESEVVAIAGKADDVETQNKVKLLIYNASVTDMLIVGLRDGKVHKVTLFDE